MSCEAWDRLSGAQTALSKSLPMELEEVRIAILGAFLEISVLLARSPLAFIPPFLLHHVTSVTTKENSYILQSNKDDVRTMERDKTGNLVKNSNLRMDVRRFIKDTLRKAKAVAEEMTVSELTSVASTAVKIGYSLLGSPSKINSLITHSFAYSPLSSFQQRSIGHSGDGNTGEESGSKELDDALYYLKLALSCVEIAISRQGTQPSPTMPLTKLAELRNIIRLYLSFVFNNLNQPDKALCLIQAIETDISKILSSSSTTTDSTSATSSSSSSLEPCVLLYAKFECYVRSNNWQQAYPILLNLLSSSKSSRISYQTCSAAVAKFLMGGSEEAYRLHTHLFQLMTTQFPEDRFVVATRISQLQYLLSISTTPPPPSSSAITATINTTTTTSTTISTSVPPSSEVSERALTLATTITTDHVQRKLVLHTKGNLLTYDHTDNNNDDRDNDSKDKYMHRGDDFAGKGNQDLALIERGGRGERGGQGQGQGDASDVDMLMPTHLHLQRSSKKQDSRSEFNVFKGIISDRVKYHRAHSQWEKVMQWCELGIALCASVVTTNLPSSSSSTLQIESTNEPLPSVERGMSFLISKADALVSLGRYKDADKAAMQAIYIERFTIHTYTQIITYLLHIYVFIIVIYLCIYVCFLVLTLSVPCTP